MLEDEVPVEQDGLNLGHERVVAVEVGPTGLDHADLRFGEVMDDLHDPLRRRNEVGVEDGDELTLGDFETCVQRPGLEAVAVSAVQVDDGLRVHAGEALGVAADDLAGDVDGFVGRVVEDLHLEAIARPVETAGGVDEALGHRRFVVERQLHGHEGHAAAGHRRGCDLGAPPGDPGEARPLRRPDEERRTEERQDPGERVSEAGRHSAAARRQWDAPTGTAGRPGSARAPGGPW